MIEVPRSGGMRIATRAGMRQQVVSFPELYLSLPGISVPDARVDNAEIVRRVRALYRGRPEDWVTIESAIDHMFGLCRTRQRFLEPNPEARVADYAVAA